jgi:hypothetical protein
MHVCEVDAISAKREETGEGWPAVQECHKLRRAPALHMSRLAPAIYTPAIIDELDVCHAGPKNFAWMAARSTVPRLQLPRLLSVTQARSIDD